MARKELISIFRNWLLALMLMLMLLMLSTSQFACPAPLLPPDAAESIPETAPPVRCYTPGPSIPKINLLDYRGQVPRQPRILRFFVKWSDNQSDLHGGYYQFTLNRTPLNKRSLPADQALTRLQGSFELPLPLPAGDYPAKQKLQVELTLWDSKGNASNQPVIVLEVQR